MILKKNLLNKLLAIPKYFYFINCSEMEKELCNMEMRSIFGKEIKEKYLSELQIPLNNAAEKLHPKFSFVPK